MHTALYKTIPKTIPLCCVCIYSDRIFYSDGYFMVRFMFQ